jgi:hypothetical protein
VSIAVSASERGAELAGSSEQLSIEEEGDPPEGARDTEEPGR